MKDKNEKQKKKRKYSRVGSIVYALKRLWRIDKSFVFFMFALAPFAALTPLVGQWFSKVLIDRIGAGAEFGELFGIVASFVLAVTLLTVIQHFLNSQCGGHRYYATCIYQLEKMRESTYNADYEATETQEYKEIFGYASRDLSGGNASMEFVWEDIYAFLKNALGIFTYASLLMVLDPLLLVVVAITSAVSWFTSRWRPAYREKVKHNWEKENRKMDYLAGLSSDFQKAKDIKLYGLEPWINGMLRDYQAYMHKWRKRTTARQMWASCLAGLMAFVQNSTAYAVLIGALLAGEITVGNFVFYFGLVGSIAGFLQGMIGGVAKLAERADKISYYREVMDYPKKLNHGKGCALPTAPVEIELRDVWYKYEGAEDYTLKGVTHTIGAGESVALVGINGAGKTTLIKLICGFYTPAKGEILVNGKRIEEYNIDEYYGLISAVFQEIRSIAFTMFEFVASCDPYRPTARADAENAMRRAGIWEKIEALENGMDTHLMKGIYDDGVELSGGEMQKLLLARAIYKDGPILVLDEPTAALDPIAENKLYMQYRELTEGKTSIYISHRFASTRFCDKILLLEDGVIKECGTHEELMRLGGKYAYMFGVQSKYYKEGEIDA